ncbi:MAG: peptidoglycan editing factor PgeF [Gammaproteobacteria bacterium]|uniref:peptidoglycan editing factor PgeF n=1 Tax=Rhodoferax sp. TaxID=50421 RepID=UPI0017938440|nr:peptidoglycan editing factor PgeF [Rhodoferax sp.]MBU3901008.1 peptidoglycan editing factor PgeF [Gammaproteobacteria bacterium]MBA3058300.1 peptidoglycan editing factor PgeF [Rhodoferax sp.]MBU3996763.1 peptidoglycan editing factor PgeF [Gammaproteobacteria bacterium]MBU4017682.1 peptidoglycan editing factor PgeF [Gammaproteobacteria bacterium]MBU4081125.1 peptidoglycan editing factor PgeF [Gammaproteobacteria bacterium]
MRPNAVDQGGSSVNFHPDWLVPQWSAPTHVHTLCTTRAGGESLAPYDGFNLGDHVGDDAGAVAANRRQLAQAMGAQPVFLSQVHGVQVQEISEHSLQGTPADGCITREPGVACTIMVADCLPVLLTNAQGTLVAAAHAGWRSLAGQGGRGILEQVIEPFKAIALVDNAHAATEIIAWLGPCIGPKEFEVGAEVRAAFVAQDSQAHTLFQAHGDGKWLADLAGLARLRLQALGVSQIYGNDSTRPWCTVSNPSRFFSYRRDGVSGRMAACIWLD